MLFLQTRVQEESQTSTRATARSELQSVELAQQHAANHARAEMVASLGAREQALSRAQAEVEVANFRAIAEMQCFARAREAEQREAADALRLCETATEAMRMASVAQTDVPRRAWTRHSWLQSRRASWRKQTSQRESESVGTSVRRAKRNGSFGVRR